MTKLLVPEIETERLILRQISEADLDDWGKQIFGNPEVLRYLPKRDISPRDRAERAFKATNKDWINYGYGEWAVTIKPDPRLIGQCGLISVKETGETEVDYSLAKPYWGRGIATEAARACVRFGFENAGLDRLIALAVPENIASRRVMEHVGLTYEKEAYFFGLDVVVYAITHEQFQADDAFYQVSNPGPFTDTKH
jgi:ribosomal-protein-alanine N-acetyltransferase